MALVGVALLARPQPTHPVTLKVLRTAGAAATLTDSRGGGAIITASNMGAGNSVTGDVRIAFDGDAAAAVTLDKTAVSGALSDVLLVAVDDLTTGKPLYAGPLATMPPVSAGTLGPGEAHDYRFTVTLPASAGNGYQSSAASIGYVWTATDAPVPPVPPDVRPPDLTVTTKPTQRLNNLAMAVQCDEPCLMSATARVGDVKGVTRPTVTISYSGTTGTLKFKFTKRALTKLIHKGRATLIVRVTAVDAAGNRTVSTQRVTITFSRAPKRVIHPIRVGVVRVGVRLR